MGSKYAALAFALLALVTSSTSRAEVTYAQEYHKRLKTSQTIQPMGPTPFGESINLFTGEVSFSHTDVLLEGIGPAIEVTRTLGQFDSSEGGAPVLNGFGDWRLALPHITTLVPGTTLDNSLVGQWQVATASGPSVNRCTQMGEMWSPPFRYYGAKSGGVDVSEWWRGYQLVMPGAGSQDLLMQAATGPLKPTSGFYPAGTTTHWQIGCLPTTSNGQPGEGFLVLSPDGTKYRLDHLSYAPYETYVWFSEFDYRTVARQPRNVARMYVSRIEDRFGNWVAYNYTGDRLDSITASDGRVVSIEWRPDAPVIKSITAQPASSNPRTWQYTYANVTTGPLSQVVLPDASSWAFDGVGIVGAWTHPVSLYGCLPSATINTGPSQETTSATVRAPSGATGTFIFSMRLHAQSSLPSDCIADGGGESSRETDNPYTLHRALISKSLSGPGLTPATWSYAYEGPHASMDRDCPTPTSCHSTRYVDVVDPSQSVTRYTHSTRWDAIQGRVLRIDYGLSGGVAAKSEVLEYEVAPGARSFAFAIGGAYLFGSSNPYKINSIIPLRAKTIYQPGRAFSWRATSFDGFARPTSVVRSSTPAP